MMAIVGALLAATAGILLYVEGRPLVLEWRETPPLERWLGIGGLLCVAGIAAVGAFCFINAA